MAELQYNTDHVHAPDIHNSYIIYKVKEGESETDFPFQFPYLKDHPETIHVFVNGEEVSFSLIPESSQVKVVLDTAATEDQEVMIQRISISDERLVNFVKRNDLKTAIMDLDSDQLFFLGQEAIDIAGLGLVFDMTTKTIDANGYRIINLGDSKDPTDALTAKRLNEVYQAIDTFIYTTVPNSIEEVDEHKDVAKDWAIKTDGKVKEDEIDIDYSSKYYADLSRQEKEASESFKDESKDWASKTDGAVEGSLYSAKQYSLDAKTIQEDTDNIKDKAAEWATKLGSKVTDEEENDIDYSSKHYATVVSKGYSEDSKEWAVKEDDPVEGTSYSSRYYSLTSFNNASLAKDWAEKMDGKINDEGYSAKYWAEQAENATKGAYYTGLTKVDSDSPAFTKTGADTLSIKAGTGIMVNGVDIKFSSTTAVTMPVSLTAGTDYAVYICDDGEVIASDNWTAPEGYTTTTSKKVGGFHYSLVDSAETVAGGSFATSGNGMIWTQSDVDRIKGINEFSIWDLKFRPSCQDPRGMVLVANQFWVDIYFTNTNHEVNGTSKAGTDVASGDVLPKKPTMMGGDGVTTYDNGGWWTFNEIASSHGKRMLKYSEFSIAAFGTTENQSLGGSGDIPVTKREDGYTSKWGIEQVSGHHYTWGQDSTYRPEGITSSSSWKDLNGGRGQLYIYNNQGLVYVIMGGGRMHNDKSGSRSSIWDNYPWKSQTDIGLRAASDHLSLP